MPPQSPSGTEVEGRHVSLRGIPLLASPMRSRKERPLLIGGYASQCTERPQWVPPPLPRCASEVPRRYELGQREALRQRRRLVSEEYQRLDFHGLGGDVEGFRAFLAHRYGGSARGWRIAIAPDKVAVNGVTFQEFCTGVKRAGYTGHAKTLWKELSKGAANAVALSDLEPDLAAQLDTCAKSIVDNFMGRSVMAWKAMPRAHGGRASFDEFKAFFEDTEEHELLSEDAHVDLRWVFDAIDIKGRGYITCEDLQFLDQWAHQRLGAVAVFPADFQDVREDPEPWSPPSRRKGPEPGLEDFRLHCNRMFGSCARAWRVGLDVKGFGLLSPSDFGKGCRSIGWKHPHHDLWCELSAAGAGVVTLRALDPETAQAIEHFKDVAQSKYGDLDSLWFQLLDPGATGAVSRTEFVADVVRELDIGADAARRLFTVLDTAQTGWIAATELGFLETFESALPPQRSLSRSNDDSQITTCLLSASSSLPSLKASSSRSLPWSPVRTEAWCPAKSNRAQQHRFFANTHMLKHRWLRGAVLERCQYGSKDMLRSARQHLGNDMRSTPEKDIFRTTNAFYREGVRRITRKASEEMDHRK